MAEQHIASQRPASTSAHRLNADGKLSRAERILWMLYNLFNNSFPRVSLDSKLNEAMFSLTEQQLSAMWGGIASTASPARALCDLFWTHLPWGIISNELGSITALEVGCGSGTYGRLLNALLGESLERYIGVDIKADAQWSGYSIDPRFSFDVGSARESGKFLPGCNLIFTQSALEHFEEDLVYFDQVSQYVLRSGHPILQVHLIPSAACMTTFPWHGVREYTPRKLSRITRLFGSETEKCLFSLGGAACNRTHRKFITWPNLRRGIDLRHAENSRYRHCLRSAILNDFHGTGRKPAFYALALASNFNNGHLLAGLA
jgi:SAM-dependent methyltransferase